MINLPIKKLRPGMVTAQSIYNSQGASYLTRGTPVNEQYISRLKKIGILELNVTSLNPSFSLQPPDDVVQEKTRVTAIHKVFDAFHQVEADGSMDLNSLGDISETILLDLFSKRSNLAQLTDIRMHDSYTFAHCVNVAILAAMLGTYCHYSKKNLLDLVLGSLLHDVGKVIVPKEILNKPSSLTQSEFAVIQMHPEAGREKLRALNISSATMLATIAAQHHEHLDGHGYPNHLMGESIHRFARIVAIADVYDALTSRRPYKPAYKPHIAYKIMNNCSQGQFDLDLLSVFFDNVAVYPTGTVLKTTLGYAIVKKSEFGHTRTPLVCVFADQAASILPRPFLVDLRDAPPDTIERVIEDKELYPLIYQMRVDPAVYLKEDIDLEKAAATAKI